MENWNITWTDLLIVVAVWLAFGGIATAIGYYKKKLFQCLLCGFVLGPIGMIYAIVIPERHKNCPRCNHALDLYRITCPDCGYEFPAHQDPQTSAHS